LSDLLVLEIWSLINGCKTHGNNMKSI